MEHGNDCTETEAHRVLKKDWTITVAELRNFLGILYTRGAYEARSLKASERLQTHKFALISEIWNRFISNSHACYKPYENISIDEHKFGIKLWLAVDVQTKYILNGFPYMGKDETRYSREKTTRWHCFPQIYINQKTAHLLCIKVKVLLLSTKHTGVRIEDNYKRVPETIAFYNKTKYGVDKMARKYSVKAGSFRWPLQVFFNILDLVAINARILYKKCTRSKISRKEFIFCLAEKITGENKENICQRSDALFLVTFNVRSAKKLPSGLLQKK